MPWDKNATDPIEWAARMKKAPRDTISRFAFSIFNRVVMRTPVDTGACRQNWLVTINSETHNFDPNKTGGSVVTDGVAVIESAKGDDKIIIQNNAPYARKLEFGGYGTKKGKKVTEEGFSKQAPHGMVGVTIAKADQLWDAAARAAQGNL